MKLLIYYILQSETDHALNDAVRTFTEPGDGIKDTLLYNLI